MPDPYTLRSRKIAVPIGADVAYAACMRTNVDHTDHTADPTNDRTVVPTDALTVAEAAEALGITTEAARMRVKRGTLSSTRVDGTVYVLLDRPNPRPNGPNAGSNDQPNPRPNGSVGGPNGRTNGHPDTGAGALLAAKDETISHLRRELDARNEELRRKDAILLTLAQRVPELEASQGGQEDVQEPASGGGVVEYREEPDGRSWWRRLLGG